MKLVTLFPSLGAVVVLTAAVAPLGCYHTQPDTTSLAQGPAPLRMPSPARQGQDRCSFEDSLTGGQIFTMYCAECHNPRPLAERPFAQYQNVAAHMRVRANLTGKEYARLMEFLRRWHDVPAPTPPTPPPPKRFIYSQPIAELRDQTAPPRPLGNPMLPPLDVLGRTPVAPAGQPPAVPTGQQPAVVPVGGSTPADATPPTP